MYPLKAFKKIKLPIRKIMNCLVNFWARSKNFYFPKKFTWRWKLEMLTDRYEPETTALFKKIIKPGMVVIDIGAHIGYYTRLFSKLTGAEGKVISFEPEPDNFQLLQKNTANLKNVKLFNLAVSDQNNKIAFFKVKNSTGCHSIIPTDNADKIIISAITIDNFINQNDIKIDVIKIDIEGGETKALSGMTEFLKNTSHLKLVTELSADSLKLAAIEPKKFLNQLRSYGFILFEISDNGKTAPLAENKIIKEDGSLAEKSINLLAIK
ncbi:MAG: FkbM family methyltransferase [Patescibacteria group bacterium]|jgi:FkbM family methyltransferase